MLQFPRTRWIVCGLMTTLALPVPALAQSAGEGSGAEAIGGGAMIKSPDHAEKGGDERHENNEQNKASDKQNTPAKTPSDAEVSSGSASPSTAPK